jgi:MerR family redox-sensitive transcriptional activator SoxR
MRIGEIARDAGLRPSAIRYYERLGLLPLPERRGGRRQYTGEVLLRLEVIRFAREAGFTLREIRRLVSQRPYSTRMRELAGAKLSQLDGVIERARTMQALLKSALRCNCLEPEECGRLLRQARSRRGSAIGR